MAPAVRSSAAASARLGVLLDGARTELREVARTRMSVLYAVPSPEMPWLSVCTPDAVRLPHSLVSDRLPAEGAVVVVGAGSLSDGERSWQVARWWRPARPRGLRRPAVVPASVDGPEPVADPLAGVPGVSLAPAELDVDRLLGAGPGLTPAGDDVVAGALVAAHAILDPRLPAWSARVRALLPNPRAWYDGPQPHVTTAVSAAVLHDALDGYATDELADFVTAACRGDDLSRARERLLAIGSSSGAALLAGALHTLTTEPGPSATDRTATPSPVPARTPAIEGAS